VQGEALRNSLTPPGRPSTRLRSISGVGRAGAGAGVAELVEPGSQSFGLNALPIKGHANMLADDVRFDGFDAIQLQEAPRCRGGTARTVHPFGREAALLHGGL
jgi:hypothetical protein